jgi:hypothetical protein
MVGICTFRTSGADAERIPNKIPGAIAIDPNNTNTVYVGSSTAVINTIAQLFDRN